MAVVHVSLRAVSAVQIPTRNPTAPSPSPVRPPVLLHHPIVCCTSPHRIATRHVMDSRRQQTCISHCSHRRFGSLIFAVHTIRRVVQTTASRDDRSCLYSVVCPKTRPLPFASRSIVARPPESSALTAALSVFNSPRETPRPSCQRDRKTRKNNTEAKRAAKRAGPLSSLHDFFLRHRRSTASTP